VGRRDRSAITLDVTDPGAIQAVVEGAGDVTAAADYFRSGGMHGSWILADHDAERHELSAAITRTGVERVRAAAMLCPQLVVAAVSVAG
jgi:hypothetical protein